MPFFLLPRPRPASTASHRWAVARAWAGKWLAGLLLLGQRPRPGVAWPNVIWNSSSLPQLSLKLLFPGRGFHQPPAFRKLKPQAARVYQASATVLARRHPLPRLTSSGPDQSVSLHPSRNPYLIYTPSLLRDPIHHPLPRTHHGRRARNFRTQHARPAQIRQDSQVTDCLLADPLAQQQIKDIQGRRNQTSLQKLPATGRV